MEELVALLQHCLSPEEAARQAAEARLGELKAQPGFAAALARIGCSSGADAAVELRQMALSVLKGFVNSGGWLQGGVTAEEQEAVHALLLAGLSDPTPRVRTAVGAVIGRIAKDEWPDRWPGLIPALAGHVQSGCPDRMAGALRCVQIFADDISDSQLPAALDGLWPTLHLVLQCDSRGAHQHFRARAMAVTHSLLSMLRLRVGVGAPGSREQLAMVLEPCLTVCLGIFRAASSVAGEASVGYGVQIHTLRTVTLLFQSFPTSMIGALDAMLPELTSMLRNGLAAFEAQQVRGAADAEESAYDSDGTPLGFDDCVVQLLELIGSLVEAPRLRKKMMPYLNDVVPLLIGFTQVTEGQLATWSEDLNQYVLDEDDESYEFSVRLVAQHVLREVSRMFGSRGQVAIGGASQSLMEQGATLRAAGSPHWWKCREAGLLGLGILVEDVENEDQRADLPADLVDAQRQLAQQLLATELAQPAEASHPCLYSRCLVAAAQGCQAVCAADGAGPPAGALDMCVAVLEVVGRGLSVDSPMIKLAACRAVNRLIPCLKGLGDHAVDMLAGFALPLLASLCSLLPQAQDDMLHLLFDSMIIAVGVNADATATMAPTLTPLLLQVWGNNLEDPFVPYNVLETLTIMTQKTGPDCAVQIGSRILPQLCAMLAVHDRDVPQGANDPRDSAVDMLTILVRHGGCDLRADDLTQQAFVLVTRLGGADGADHCSADHSVLQNAAECVRLFVQRMPEQLTAFANTEGVTGLHRCVAVVSWLLSTHLDDSAALQVGSLVTALIRHCGHILDDVVTSMLRALVTRLRTAHFPSLIQELLVVLAHIVNRQGAAQTVEFLWTCEPEGAALGFVMSLFIENLPFMIRPYHIKVCCAALGAVCATRDARVLSVNLDTTNTLDDDSSDGVASRTRSKKVVQTFSAPLPLVTLREIVRALGQQELAQQERAAAGTRHCAAYDDGEEEEDEYDEESYDHQLDQDEHAEEDDDGPDGVSGTFAAASDFEKFEQFLQYGDNDGLDEDDEEEDDPDDAADPIYHTELKAIVGQYARVLYERVGADAFGQECSLLDGKERVFLQNVLVTTAGSSN